MSHVASIYFLIGYIPMPETAKILQFPSASRRRVISSAEVKEIARDYLSESITDRSESHVASCLADADVVVAILSELRSRADSTSGPVADEASTLYFSLQSTKSIGLFDERDYFWARLLSPPGRHFVSLGRAMNVNCG